MIDVTFSSGLLVRLVALAGAAVTLATVAYALAWTLAQLRRTAA